MIEGDKKFMKFEFETALQENYQNYHFDQILKLLVIVF